MRRLVDLRSTLFLKIARLRINPTTARLRRNCCNNAPDDWGRSLTFTATRIGTPNDALYLLQHAFDPVHGDVRRPLSSHCRHTSTATSSVASVDRTGSVWNRFRFNR